MAHAGHVNTWIKDVGSTRVAVPHRERAPGRFACVRRPASKFALVGRCHVRARGRMSLEKMGYPMALLSLGCGKWDFPLVSHF
jgi:hypothetical protein